jgi:hypothetical protein
MPEGTEENQKSSKNDATKMASFLTITFVVSIIKQKLKLTRLLCF